MKKHLKPITTDIEDHDQAIAVLKKMAGDSAQACERAANYYNTMQAYHKHMVSLMGELEKLRGQAPNAELREEYKSIADAAQEVCEAMQNLRTNEFEDQSASLDAIEREIINGEGGTSALAEVDRENQTFLQKYFFHKARLGLKTQDDVAAIVRLKRQHISKIESGKQRPQFKTVQRIADAFGISVSDLIS